MSGWDVRLRGCACYAHTPGTHVPCMPRASAPRQHACQILGTFRIFPVLHSRREKAARFIRRWTHELHALDIAIGPVRDTTIFPHCRASSATGLVLRPASGTCALLRACPGSTVSAKSPASFVAATGSGTSAKARPLSSAVPLVSAASGSGCTLPMRSCALGVAQPPGDRVGSVLGSSGHASAVLPSYEGGLCREAISIFRQFFSM